MGGRTYRPNSSVSCLRPLPSFPFDSASVGVGSATTLARCLRTASTSPGRMGSLRWCLGGISQTPITQESRLRAQVFTKKGGGGVGIRDPLLQAAVLASSIAKAICSSLWSSHSTTPDLDVVAACAK